MDRCADFDTTFGRQAGGDAHHLGAVCLNGMIAQRSRVYVIADVQSPAAGQITLSSIALSTAFRWRQKVIGLAVPTQQIPQRSWLIDPTAGIQPSCVWCENALLAKFTNGTVRCFGAIFGNQAGHPKRDADRRAAPAWRRRQKRRRQSRTLLRPIDVGHTVAGGGGLGA